MRIHTYSLMRDVIASQQRPRQPDSLWKTSPLVVMNNFSGQEHLKLASVLFQNLFPAINVQTAQLASCQVSLKLNAYIPPDVSRH
jgi:ribosome biogenesis protein SSF1/2